MVKNKSFILLMVDIKVSKCMQMSKTFFKIQDHKSFILKILKLGKLQPFLIKYTMIWPFMCTQKTLELKKVLLSIFA